GLSDACAFIRIAGDRRRDRPVDEWLPARRCTGGRWRRRLARGRSSARYDSEMRDSLTWYVVVQVAGFAAWPPVAHALEPLEDRGWAASKAAGLLGVAWVVWLLFMLTPLPFTRGTLLVAALSVGVGAWL